MILNSVVLSIFFLLELASLAAFGYWGFHINAGTVVKIAMGIGTPLIVAILWGVFLSPKASIPVVPFPVRNVLKFVVFVLASTALYTGGRSSLAVAFLVTALLETALVYALKL